MSVSPRIVSFVLLAIVTLVAWSLGFSAGGRRTVSDTPPGQTQDEDPLARLAASSRKIAKEVGPAVVRIDVGRSDATGASGGNGIDDDFEQLYGSDVPGLNRRDPLGQGSGLVVTSDGYIVTNYHVVRSAETITVATGNHQWSAQMVGYDVLTDLAVIKVETEGLATANWGDSDQLDVGDFVWAIGNPFGLQRSLTFGIVSAKSREQIADGFLDGFLQTDAAVNPGNSGGPLVDHHGRIVGINTAIVGSSYQGVSFAIPSNVARTVFDQLRRVGRVRRGWLGVVLAKPNGLSGANEGAIVTAFSQRSDVLPARAAGIRPGDRIVRWNEIKIADPQSLSHLSAEAPIGSTVQVTLVREGQTMTLPLVVGERP